MVKTRVLEDSAKQKEEGGDFHFSVGESEGGIWEPNHGAILSCGVTRIVNTVWDSTSKLKTVRVASSQELVAKDGMEDKESVSTGGLHPQKDLLCSIDGNYMFTRSRQTSRKLDTKYLVHA